MAKNAPTTPAVVAQHPDFSKVEDNLHRAVQMAGILSDILQKQFASESHKWLFKKPDCYFINSDEVKHYLFAADHIEDLLRDAQTGLAQMLDQLDQMDRTQAA